MPSPSRKQKLAKPVSRLSFSLPACNKVSHICQVDEAERMQGRRHLKGLGGVVRGFTTSQHGSTPALLVLYTYRTNGPMQ